MITENIQSNSFCKKILFLTGSYDQCGGVYSMLTLMQCLKKRGHDVALVIGRHGSAEEVEKEYNISSKYVRSYSWIISLNKQNNFITQLKIIIKKALNLIEEVRLRHVIKSFAPDIVIMNSSDQYVGIKSCNRLGIPVVMHFREYMTLDHNKGYWSEKMANKYFSKLDGGIAISQDVKKYFSRYTIKNMQVIYNGVDVNKYKIKNKNKSKLSFSISCVGRLCEGKNQKLAIETAKELIQCNIFNFHIYFYGDDTNNYATNLKNYVRDQGLEEYITFVGVVNDVEKIYSGAHINLLCSKREAFGRVIIEGMLNHCLCIVPNSGGVKEIVKDHYNGLLFNQEDDRSLFNVLVYAMNNYDSLYPVIEQGYQDAETHYTAESNSKNVEVYLQKICYKYKHNECLYKDDRK